MSKAPGEFELIARLTAKLRQSRRTILGPGDDCAILAPAREPQLVTIDSMVEGVHFKLEWFTPEILGARALTVNLSDIAAMGGFPTACVVNLAIRPGLGARFFDRLYAGLTEAASASGTDIVGGNVTSADALAITITLIGAARRSTLRTRCGPPRRRDFVTGTVGDAALGWRILAGKVRARGSCAEIPDDRFFHPVARLAVGQRLAQNHARARCHRYQRWALAGPRPCAERSGVGAEIEAGAIPAFAAYRAVKADDLEFALSGGEDYELLFCLPPAIPKQR